MHLKSQQEVKAYYTNQSLKEAVKTLQENRNQLSFEQVRVIRDLLDECVLNNYGNRKYDGTNGNGYSPIATFDNPHATPPKKR